MQLYAAHQVFSLRHLSPPLQQQMEEQHVHLQMGLPTTQLATPHPVPSTALAAGHLLLPAMQLVAVASPLKLTRSPQQQPMAVPRVHLPTEQKTAKLATHKRAHQRT
jgi:hypothetical protein